MKNNYLKITLLCLTFAFFSCNVFVKTFSIPIDTDNLPQKAELELKAGNKDEAIKLYRQHIQNRLADKTRKEWENPYFYNLLIGDIYLERTTDNTDDVSLALKYYLEARDKNVETSLISDRLRKTAEWFEIKGDLNTAIKILEDNKEVDPLLFDVVLDRLAKKMLAEN